jgi:AraC family transcriptional regulator
MAQGLGIRWVRRGSLMPEPIPGVTVAFASDERWATVRVDEVRAVAASGELPEGTYRGHLLSLNVGRPMRLEGFWGGEPRRELVFPPGHFILVPAGMPHAVRWQGAGAVVRVEMTSETVAALVDEGNSESTPAFRLLVNERDPFVSHVALAFRDLVRDGKPEGTYGETLAAVLAEHLIRRYGSTPREPVEVRGGLAPASLRRVLNYVGTNLERDITLRDLAREAGTSVFHFARLFKRRTGLSPHQYLLQRRIDQARSLLGDENLSIGEVALRCGFAHPSHFSETFRRVTGVTPRAYRS